ncbi:hypothetical protein Vqi01_46810 [Micromonospora qiuiae]|uniref:Terpene synthase n=1 Tax=Micromonospora qiuiae TaxID=502268 RepID=A0ABQ4JJ77_9ACTN|nr:hypothetical protein [Micromonospora qiuiae]GIJ29519.1 hypothetical protein Vqi01_46810 [Micromonospora qiuiae]
MAGPREFFLPELPRLLPVGYHPKAAQIEIASNGWVRRCMGGCFASEDDLMCFLRQRNGLYGPLVVPDAEEDRAQNVADWYQFIAALERLAADRPADEAAHHVSQVVQEIVVGPQSGSGDEPSPYGCAARSLWSRISVGLTGAQVQRFAKIVEMVANRHVPELALPSASPGERLGLQDRMAARVSQHGCGFLELLTEYAAGVDMSEFIGSPVLAETHEHTRWHLILVRDLLSWRRLHDQPGQLTAIRILLEEDGLPLQAAVNRLCELIEYHERAYITARSRILAAPVGNRADVRAYLIGLDQLIAGNQEHEHLTSRNLGDGAVWDGTTCGWLSLDTPVASFRTRGAEQGRPSTLRGG